MTAEWRAGLGLYCQADEHVLTPTWVTPRQPLAERGLSGSRVSLARLLWLAAPSPQRCHCPPSSVPGPDVHCPFFCHPYSINKSQLSFLKI